MKFKDVRQRKEVMKPITSKDKRKRSIMEEIKKRTGANRVTCVRESKTHYVGSPMKKTAGHGRCGGYQSLPECFILKSEMNLEDDSNK